MKFMILVATVLCMFAGCVSDREVDFYKSPTNATAHTDFGGDVYVWESFNFSTNRVYDAK